ncbi:MAG: hypothetical protein HZY76_01300 [Anaerolineae bacterium]|nr:MAG: hypothetical protein HZY76_01300 [Anaerolineae bacterium]
MAVVLLALLLLALIPSPQPWGWGGRNQPWGAGRTPQPRTAAITGYAWSMPTRRGLAACFKWSAGTRCPCSTAGRCGLARGCAAPGQPLRLAVRDDRQVSRVYGQGTGDWQWLEVVHPVAVDTQELRILVSPGIGEDPRETGVIDVDDASLTVVGSALTTNLLRNPGASRAPPGAAGCGSRCWTATSSPGGARFGCWWCARCASLDGGATGATGRRHALRRGGASRARTGCAGVGCTWPCCLPVSGVISAGCSCPCPCPFMRCWRW